MGGSILQQEPVTPEGHTHCVGIKCLLNLAYVQFVHSL